MTRFSSLITVYYAETLVFRYTQIMMLRFLRSRRRPPPYGSYICAAVSSLLLLLLSVSFLYTDLARSLPHPHLLHAPVRGEEGAYGTGKIEDKIDELDLIEEDRGQQREEVDLEEEDVGFGDRIEGTGYFFDQVSGSIRRGFGKRSIEEWEDDRFGSRMEEDGSRTVFASDDTPVDEEVRRKAAMVVGVEDALLLKMGRRNSPLREGWGDWFDKKGEFLRKNKMFKSNWAVLDPLNNLILQDPDGVGVTKLTEDDREVQNWWMNEFNRTPFLGEKTLDMPKVTRDSELQENENEAVNYNTCNCNCKSARDSRSETKETECGTLNDNGAVTKTGHGGHKNLRGNDVETFKSDKETRNDIKGAENRTLDEDVDNGSINDLGTLATLVDRAHDFFDESMDDGFAETDMDAGGDLNSADKYLDGEEHGSGTRQGNNVDNVREQDRSRGSKDVTSEIQRRPEFLNHIYADGERWGYYPGLPAHLTFTEFMEAFFRLGKCDMRVFMVWNSPPWMYGVRHQRGLESLLFHHRDACVVVFSETVELDFFRDNFVNNGYKVAVAMPNLDELLKDTPSHIFASVWFEWRKTKFYSTHYSELIRLAALYKYGGIYLDSDIIVLKPVFSLNNSVGMEDHVGGSALNGAVMAFRRHSLFIEECLKEFYMTYDDTSLRWNGADLLTRVARNFLRDRNQYVNQLELKVEPMNTFFPISSQNIIRYFMEPETEIEKAQQDLLFDKILHESMTFHFWNSLTSALIPEPESLVARLINYFCIRCLELL